MIEELIKDPKKRFSYVEMSYFSMWWKQQTPFLKDKVRNLVKNGQLELVNGGWVMYDEACPTYSDMLANMNKGHQFIKEEFSVKPRIGW